MRGVDPRAPDFKIDPDRAGTRHEKEAQKGQLNEHPHPPPSLHAHTRKKTSLKNVIGFRVPEGLQQSSSEALSRFVQRKWKLSDLGFRVERKFSGSKYKPYSNMQGSHSLTQKR